MKVMVVGPYPPCEDTNGLLVRAWGNALVRSEPSVRLHVAASEEDPGRPVAGVADPTGGSAPRLTVHRMWRRDDPVEVIVASILGEADAFGPEVCHLHFNYFTYGNPLKSFAVVSRLLGELGRRGTGTIVTLHSVVASPVRYLAVRWGLEIGIPRWVDRFSARLGALALDRALRDAGEIVVVSRDGLDWLERHTSIRAPRATYIPLGAITDGRELRATGATAAGADGEAPRVASVGRLVPYKGLESLIRAVGVLGHEERAIKLTVMGSVEENAPSNRWYVGRLRRLAHEVGNGSVRLEARYVPDPEYSALQQAADVIVLPFRDDGVIGASGSALAFGAFSPARLVLTDVPRLKEYQGVPGVYYCRDGDPWGMAETIWAAARAAPVDPADRGRELSSRTPSSIAAQYLDSYRRVAGPSPSRGRAYFPEPGSEGTGKVTAG